VKTGWRSACAVIVSTVAAAAAPAANPPAAPPQAANAPANMHVELGTLTITRGQTFDGKHYMAPNPAQRYDKKSHDVGWYAQDTTMGKKDGPTLHYGAHNLATYTYGTQTPGSRGTFWTPAFAISPKLGCTVSFVHSYALANASRLGLPDVMTFSYSFDGVAWTDEALPKPAVSIPWTTFTKAIPCQGHSQVWLSWDFDSKNDVPKGGRGWNLKSFDLKQG
jgi:hypothetical protein